MRVSTTDGHGSTRNPGRCWSVPLRLILCPLLLSIAATSISQVQFSDVTSAVGMTFEHRNSATASKYLVETMGGGVALLDYDNDGRLDVFLTNGAKIDDPMPDGKQPDKSDRAFWNRLYRQTADGRFADVTEKAEISGMPQNHYGMGTAGGGLGKHGFEKNHVDGDGGKKASRQQREG